MAAPCHRLVLFWLLRSARMRVVGSGRPLARSSALTSASSPSAENHAAARGGEMPAASDSPRPLRSCLCTRCCGLHDHLCPPRFGRPPGRWASTCFCLPIGPACVPGTMPAAVEVQPARIVPLMIAAGRAGCTVRCPAFDPELARRAAGPRCLNQVTRCRSSAPRAGQAAREMSPSLLPLPRRGGNCGNCTVNQLTRLCSSRN
jgi:hypothetical protein